MTEATEVKVQYAKTHLSALLKRVEAGEEIVISRGDAPVARLVPAIKPRRELGFLAHLGIEIPDSAFFDPLPEEELRQWEGADDDPDLWREAPSS